MTQTAKTGRCPICGQVLTTYASRTAGPQVQRVGLHYAEVGGVWAKCRGIGREAEAVAR